MPNYSFKPISGSQLPQAPSQPNQAAKQRLETLQKMAKQKQSMDLEKRTQFFSTLQDKYKDEAIGTDKYLSGFDNLIREAGSPVERQHYQDMQSIAKSNVLGDKLDKERNVIEANFNIKQLTAKQAYNQTMELSQQAAQAGLEMKSAMLQLEASYFTPQPEGGSAEAEVDIDGLISQTIYGY